MSTLQVANLWFESTANNRFQYTGSNTFAIVAAGANVITVNSTSFVVGSNGLKLTNGPFIEAIANVTVDYTMTSGYNAMTPGPITISSGVTVTVPSGSVWTVV